MRVNRFCWLAPTEDIKVTLGESGYIPLDDPLVEERYAHVIGHIIEHPVLVIENHHRWSVGIDPFDFPALLSNRRRIVGINLPWRVLSQEDIEDRVALENDHICVRPSQHRAHPLGERKLIRIVVEM